MRAWLPDRQVYLPAKPLQEHGKSYPGIWNPFGSQCRQLISIEGLSFCVGKQPVKHAGQMLSMETRRGYPGRLFPEKIFRKAFHKGHYLFTSLQQCVRYRLQQGRHLGKRSAQPYFRKGWCIHKRLQNTWQDTIFIGYI